MAHELTHDKKGNAMAAFVGEVPWHGKGQMLGDKTVTAPVMQKAAGMEWEPELVPLYGEVDTEFVLVPNRMGVVGPEGADGKRRIIGNVGSSYRLIGHRAMFDFAEGLVGKGKSYYSGAGSLREGSRPFITLELPGELLPRKGDAVKKYLLLSNSHDGSLMFGAMFTGVRVVCMNTLRQALSGTRHLTSEEAMAQGIVRIRHDGSAERRVEEAKKILGLAMTTYDDMERVFKAMAAKVLKPKEWKRGVEDMAPIPEADKDDEKAILAIKKDRDEIDRLGMEGMGQDGTPSVWALYNGATEFFQHHDFGVQAARTKAQDKFLDRLWFGGIGERTDHAYRVAASLVGAAK